MKFEPTNYRNERRRKTRCAARSNNVSRLIEILEERRFFDATYFNLAAGTLSQNWENKALIMTSDVWSGVPSIEGYRGDDVVSATGVDPQTALASDTPGRLNVLANQTVAPSTITAGTVAEFELATPIGTTATTGNNTVALQGSGTADAPYLKLYLNSANVNNVQVQFDLIDIDAGVPATPSPVPNQQFAVQYRIGESAAFINVPSGYVMSAADPSANAVGKTTHVTALLPVGANNASQVQVRIITTNAPSDDQFVAVDNIAVSGTPAAPAPGTLGFNPASYVVVEGVGTFNVTVKRTGGTAGSVSANYALVGGTAVSGSDFTAATGTVTFADGVDTATIPVTITQDSLVEGNENFTITLTSPTGGASVDGVAATVTITDDDNAGTVAFNPATATVNENAGTVMLTVTRSGGTSGAVTVDYATSNGSALAGSDYTAKSGTLSFANGVDTATITISILDDSISETLENFIVTLSNPTGGLMLGQDATATVSISDNDGAAPVGLLINEVFIDPPGTNAPMQFVELKGTPGQVLTNVYLISIEGDIADNPGNVDGSINLSGAVLGSNGLLFVKAANGGFAAGDPATGVFTTTFFDTTSIYSLEPGSTTLLLVYRDPTGVAAPVEGADLDSDNASTANVGTLDALPSNITILDGYGALDGGASDIVYVSTPLVSRGGAADAVVRFPGNNATLSASAFYYGILKDNDQVGTGNSTVTFSTDAAQRSTNFPLTPGGAPAGYVTPGAANVPVSSDNVAPTFVSASFDPRQGQKIVVTFSEDVGASLSASDFVLTNTTTGTAVTLVKGALSSDGTSVTLTFTGTGGATSTVLKDGNYQLKVLAGQVADTAGNTLAADATSTFKFLNADFNVSGAVDFSDLLVLAQHFGTSSGATFSIGDANYDGKVDFSDLLLLAQKFGTSAPAILSAFHSVRLAPVVTHVATPVATHVAIPAPLAPRSATVLTSKKGDSIATRSVEPVVIAPAPKRTFASAKRIA